MEATHTVEGRKNGRQNKDSPGSRPRRTLLVRSTHSSQVPAQPGAQSSLPLCPAPVSRADEGKYPPIVSPAMAQSWAVVCAPVGKAGNELDVPTAPPQRCHWPAGELCCRGHPPRRRELVGMDGCPALQLAPADAVPDFVPCQDMPGVGKRSPIVLPSRESRPPRPRRLFLPTRLSPACRQPL